MCILLYAFKCKFDYNSIIDNLKMYRQVKMYLYCTIELQKSWQLDTDLPYSRYLEQLR